MALLAWDATSTFLWASGDQQVNASSNGHFFLYYFKTSAFLFFPSIKMREKEKTKKLVRSQQHNSKSTQSRNPKYRKKVTALSLKSKFRGQLGGTVAKFAHSTSAARVHGFRSIDHGPPPLFLLCLPWPQLLLQLAVRSHMHDPPAAQRVPWIWGWGSGSATAARDPGSWALPLLFSLF